MFEYLMYKYHKTALHVVEAPQGDKERDLKVIHKNAKK